MNPTLIEIQILYMTSLIYLTPTLIFESLMLFNGNAVCCRFFNFIRNRKQHLLIMEENLHKSTLQQPNAYLKQQINEIVLREQKSTQALRFLIDQFKAKQSSRQRFDRQSFTESAYKNFIEVQHVFQKINTKIFAFPILEKLSMLLSTINMQYFHLFRFSNEKWQHQYKIIEQVLKSKSDAPPFKVDLCLKCSENKWHQQIKSEKHRLYNFRIDDPFYYFQEPTLYQRESNGEEIDHKVLQQKLSELALGVEMQQRCLRELLDDMNSKEKENQDNMLTDSISHNENIYLPLMPMLRSVFNHARGRKNKFQELGVQTMPVPQKIVKVVELLPNAQINDMLAQKDKIQYKLITQLTDKNIQIKDLQEKISIVEKSQSEIKAQHGVLLEENMILQRRNSLLEVQLSNSKTKQTNQKVKILNKKKVSEDVKEDLSTTMNNKTYNNYNQSNLDSFTEKSQQQSHPGGRIRGNLSNESKFKMQTTQNKTMFIPNIYQSMRQSVTPGKLSSAISIQRSSAKLEDDGLTSVADFPSIRPSIHTNQLISDKIVGFKQPQEAKEATNQQNKEETNDDKKEIKEIANKSKRKLKQITKTQINNTNSISNNNYKEFVRSENQSPQPQSKVRRTGKFQDRQSLLRMLFKEQTKENKELSYDHFKRSYENFVIKVVGISDFQTESSNKYAKINHLQKKSTVSIKQYLRSQVSDSRNELCIMKDNTKYKNHPHRESRFTKDSACLKQIMNNLYAEGVEIDPIVMDETINQRTVLVKEEFSVMTQILAYMIQLKVSNLNSYSKVKTIISFEPGQRKKGNPQFQQKEQNIQLKNSLASIIKSHRKCQTKQPGQHYCVHLSTFLRNIVALIEK